MARHFNGTSTDHVDLPAGVVLALNDPVSIFYWSLVLTAEVQVASAFTIGDIDNGGVDRCQAHAPYAGNTIYWDCGNYATVGRISTSYTSQLDRWAAVGFTSSGTANTFKGVYLDGVVATSAASSSGATQALTGGKIGGWPGGGGFYHKGTIAEFAVWNKVLTPGEFADLAGNASPTTIQPGNLLGYWPLDGSSPEPDMSGNGRDATVNGTTFVPGKPWILPGLALTLMDRSRYPRPVLRVPA
jgi:Concanavalin A-like lectin/glucanases superfamily